MTTNQIRKQDVVDFDTLKADHESGGHVSALFNPAAIQAAQPSLILPALCHPHIHLDKAYLLTSNQIRAQSSTEQNDSESVRLPDYSDLIPQSGTFQEALSFTSKAKERYTTDDLILRGSQLIAESLAYGVTSMRAFVEIDHVTKFKCLEAAIQLKNRFSSHCYIQICAFAQDPITSGDHGDENRELMQQALTRYCADASTRSCRNDDDENNNVSSYGNKQRSNTTIETLGTTPYVESSYETGLANVKWAIETALTYDLHLDFHLDYNLDPSQKVMTFDVIRLLHEAKWSIRSTRKIMLGHCTRLTLLPDHEMRRLREQIGDLPVSFVGLPTSDVFMMGRPSAAAAKNDDGNSKGSGQRPRGTLQVLDMIEKYEMNACLGVNNVGNAFTPWGKPDPLMLASLGVGLYQAGTEEHAELLYQCVSTRARKAIGLESGSSGGGGGGGADGRDAAAAAAHIYMGLEIKNEESITVPGTSTATSIRVPARQRKSIKDVVWDPPDRNLRRLVP